MSRRIDLSKFKGNSDDEDEDLPMAPKNQLSLSHVKQQTFTHGHHKKSRKDIERETEERKRVEEEKLAAIAYKEFEEAFGGEGVEGAPLGGTRGRGGRGAIASGRGGFVKAGGSSETYQPSRSYPPSGPSTFARGGMPPPMQRERSPSPDRSKPKPKGKRAMDSFLEQIKRDQAERERKFGKTAALEGSSISALAAWEKERGSRDIGDPETTNLYISNLPTAISEESLGLFFAKYGPVGTVKIMWPRGDEDSSIGASITTTRRAKAGLSGFVSYLRRKDAEAAVKELDGLDWGGSVLRVGWSKAVKVPARAIYDLSTGRDDKERRRSRSPVRRGKDPKSRSRSRSRSKDRYNSSRRDRSRSRSRSPPRRAARSSSRGRSRSRSYSTSSSYSSRSSHSRSRTPKQSRHAVVLEKLLKRIGGEKEKFVKAVAERVKQHGREFEDMLRVREKMNEKFGFLRDSELPEYHLYKLLLNPNYRLPSPPPDDFSDSGKASIYSTDSAEESERERTRKGSLGKFARRRFESTLRRMTGEREEIARGMEFAMTHADSADEVADIVCQSLKIESTPVPRKLARLHLISDILHNSASSLPNVWRYRQAFETRLPLVFEHLADVHRSLVAYAGRISGEAFKGQCGFVLEIWENWIVFTPQVTEQMKAILNGAPVPSTSTPSLPSSTDPTPTINPAPSSSSTALPSKFKKASKSGFKTFIPVSTGPSYNAPAPMLPVEDLDGEEMDIDGEEVDLDGEEVDLDGEDLDGEEMS